MKTFLTLVLSMSLAACGGGGSSGGAGSANTSLAGTYLGSGALTFSAPGVPTNSEAFSIKIEIDADGNVRVIDGGGTFASGRLDGDSFSLTASPISVLVDGGSCSGTPTITGKVSGGEVSGDIFALFDCTVGNARVPVTVNGPYKATSNRSAQAHTSSAGLRDSLRKYLRR